MRRYLAYFEQQYGCDHTIGCGRDLMEFEASDPRAAQIHIASVLKTWSDELFESLDSVRLFELSDNSVGEVNFSAIKEIRQQAKRQDEHLKDLEEFERLKKKLGK